MHQKKCCKEKHVDLLLIGEGEKNTMFLSMISIDPCMIIHYIAEENIFLVIAYMLSLKNKYQSVILKLVVKMPKKDEYVKFKNFERKLKSPFMIYADFESMVVHEDNGKQNPNDSYTNKYQKHVACSYGYKLLCVDDKFSKPFKPYLSEDVVYNFIGSMIEESKCCSDMMKKHFNLELAMTKKDNEDFENSTKCWICDNDYIDNDVKFRDHHCHITGKCKGSAHRDCNINVKFFIR